MDACSAPAGGAPGMVRIKAPERSLRGAPWGWVRWKRKRSSESFSRQTPEDIAVGLDPVAGRGMTCRDAQISRAHGCARAMQKSGGNLPKPQAIGGRKDQHSAGTRRAGAKPEPASGLAQAVTKGNHPIRSAKPVCRRLRRVWRPRIVAWLSPARRLPCSLQAA